MSAPRCGCDRISSQSSSVRRVPVSVWSGKVNLPTSCSRPAVWTSSCSRDGQPGGGGGRLGEAGDGGGVAGGHPVAHPQRLHHHADHALVQRLELGDLDAQLVALLPRVGDEQRERPEREQQGDEQADREQPELLVGGDGRGGQQAGGELPRQHRDVEAPERAAQARAVAQAEHPDDEPEVQDARGEVDAEDDRGACERGARVGAGVAERLERERARDGVDGQRNDIAEHERDRRAGRDDMHEQRREGDQRGRRGPEQGHRERGRDERRADRGGPDAQRDELAAEGQRQQAQRQVGRLPVAGGGPEHGRGDRGCEQHGLAGGEDLVPPAYPRSGGDLFNSLRPQRH